MKTRLTIAVLLAGIALALMPRPTIRLAEDPNPRHPPKPPIPMPSPATSGLKGPITPGVAERFMGEPLPLIHSNKVS